MNIFYFDLVKRILEKISRKISGGTVDESEKVGIKNKGGLFAVNFLTIAPKNLFLLKPFLTI